jgi:hypothetical protein
MTHLSLPAGTLIENLPVLLVVVFTGFSGLDSGKQKIFTCARRFFVPRSKREPLMVTVANETGVVVTNDNGVGVAKDSGVMVREDTPAVCVAKDKGVAVWPETGGSWAKPASGALHNIKNMRTGMSRIRNIELEKA